MPEISVIVPTYNRGYIVKEAIDSILAQTFPDFEVLVVDDGSTDNTEGVIRSIKDSRIKYFYKENGGVANALNYGIVRAKGDLVGILASDDLWPGDFLEILKKRLDENPNAGVAYTAVTQRYPDGRQIKSYDIEHCVSGSITAALFEHSLVPPMAVLIRRSVIPGFLFDENLKICEDNDAFLRLSVNTNFLFVPDTQVIRRESLDTVTSGTYTTGSYIRAYSLERFYFQLGGNRLVPARIAKRKLSHAYRRAAERHRKQGYRKAAIAFYKRAIKYKPTDIRLYLSLAKCRLINRAEDKCPDWTLPLPLGEPYSAVVKSREDK